MILLGRLVVLAICLSTASAFGAELLPPFPTCAPTSAGSSDDTGFAPDARHMFFLCEEGMDKAAAYFAEAVIVCYRKAATEPDRDACIEKARQRWLSTLPGPTNFYPCPACLDRPAIMNQVAVRYREFAERIYCDGGASRCQAKGAFVAGRFARRIMGLHMGLWPRIYRGTCTQPFEDAAKKEFYRKFRNLAQSQGDCPPCLDLTTFADDMERDVDSHNGDIFCATESELRTH